MDTTYEDAIETMKDDIRHMTNNEKKGALIICEILVDTLHQLSKNNQRVSRRKFQKLIRTLYKIVESDTDTSDNSYEYSDASW